MYDRIERLGRCKDGGVGGGKSGLGGRWRLRGGFRKGIELRELAFLRRGFGRAGARGGLWGAIGNERRQAI